MFWGKTETFGGEAETFWGKAEMFEGKAETFWGKAETFWGKTETFWGKTETFGGEAEMVGGKTETLEGEAEMFGGWAEKVGGKAEMHFSSPFRKVSLMAWHWQRVERMLNLPKFMAAEAAWWGYRLVKNGCFWGGRKCHSSLQSRHSSLKTGQRDNS